MGYSPWDHKVRHDWVTNTFSFRNFMVLCYAFKSLIFLELDFLYMVMMFYFSGYECIIFLALFD